MKKWCILFLFSGFLLFNAQKAYAVHLTDYEFIKITVRENGISYEWEYENPDHFEYEFGEKVWKDERARKLFTDIIKKLQLTEDAKVEQMVERLQNDGYPNIEKLAIRMMNHEGKLRTWVWHKQK